MAAWFIESEYQHIGDMVMQKTMPWAVGKPAVQVLVLKGIDNSIKKKQHEIVVFIILLKNTNNLLQLEGKIYFCFLLIDLCFAIISIFLNGCFYKN